MSHFTATYLAFRGLDAFGTNEQADHIASRKKRALDWLLRTEPKDTEDRAFRLLALQRLDADAEQQGGNLVKSERRIQAEGAYRRAAQAYMEAPEVPTHTKFNLLKHARAMLADLNEVIEKETRTDG